MPSPAADVAAAVITGVPALAVVLLGWLLNRKDLQSEIAHLRAQNVKLSDDLHLALYGRREGPRE